ncbi:MAG: formylglycine-generating enzyme family protein [Proteobacteria bacterium]|nr:formylglycine-generating enzyme family protein [Pseudomonadota bacterium]
MQNKGLQNSTKLSCYSLMFISALTLSLAFFSSSFAAEVKNAVSRQEGNRVIWEFEVVSDTQEEADLTLTITIDGKTYESKDLHLEGDFPKTKLGKGRKIYWNVLQDFPRGIHGNLDWELLAGGMELVFVKGGCYDMGDTFGDSVGSEKLVHNVCVSDFYMGKYEVTQGQWKVVMGNNPSHFSSCGDTCPVENVSWKDSQEFIRKLNSRTGKSYRLPTEAEWEYAARSGGKKEKYAGTSSDSDLGSYAWYKSNSAHPVGQKQPNSLGLYDMSGNVWEWCQDWYDKYYYSSSIMDNPQGPSSGSYRVLRGGSWGDNPRGVRASIRSDGDPLGRNNYDGFRVVSSSR